jgi:ATP-dependent exoDNAse (exonuclease V) beta subunit
MANSYSPSTQTPNVYIVEASAGSGKTYALSKRYIDLLFQEKTPPHEIKNILAITFTNKATKEMKERILGFLKEIALNLCKEEILFSVTDKNTAKEKASVILDYIMQNYSFFQVKTIDSFVNIILSGCAYSLKLPANFKIAKEYEEFLSYALNEYIDRASKDNGARETIEHFLRQYIYLENKNNWLPKNDMFKLIQSMFTKSTLYGKPFRQFNLGTTNILREKEKILEKYKNIYNNLPEEIDKTFANTINRFLHDNDKSFDFSFLSNTKSLIRDAVKVKKGGVIPPKIEKEWSTLQEDIRKLAEKEAYSLLNCYIDIFNPVYKSLTEYAHKEDVLFLSELNRRANELINQNSITVPELYYRLAARFRHYLIDEFQDTSRLQWENLHLMIEDAVSQNGTLYYVGDKKQAIYRFRAGDVSLFDDIKDKFSKFKIKDDKLITNYRSGKIIVDFNNAVFSSNNLKDILSSCQPKDEESLKVLGPNDIKEITGIFDCPKQLPYNNVETGYVRTELVKCEDTEDKEEKIKEKLIPLVLELKKRSMPKDIGILCRENRDVELVSRWLIEAGINVESDKTLNIKNNKYIKEIISFLKFLNSPIDNLSFSSFVLGNIFSSVSGMGREKIESFILKYRYVKGNLALYKEFKNTYPQIWKEYIEESFKNVGFIRLYELLIDIFRKFKIIGNFPSFHGFFVHLLEIVKKLEDKYDSLSSFLEFFDELDDENVYVNYSGSDAVCALSIHKAKGLGFGIVIIPFLELDINDIGPGSKGKDTSYTVTEENNHLLVLKLTSKYNKLSDKIAAEYKKEYIKSLIDEINASYVALTRAKYEMYIFIPFGMKGTNNIARFLIPNDCFERGILAAGPVRNSISRGTSSPEFTIPAPQYKTWIGFLKNEFIDIETIKNKNNILKGEILHYALSLIGNLKGKDSSVAIAEAFKETVSEYPAISDFCEFEPIIEKVIENINTRCFFYIDDGEVFTEKEIVNKDGHTKRIDRLIVKKDIILVIDYKTRGDITEGYKNQIEEYIEILKNIYPDKQIKGFLLFLEDTRVEEL